MGKKRSYWLALDEHGNAHRVYNQKPPPGPIAFGWSIVEVKA